MGMGSYVNPGNARFRRDVNDYLYIDKTELIAHTNDRLGRASCYLCVSRPRRFGKSMAANMLEAYYSRGCDSRDLFAGRNIEAEESYRLHLNRHNLIRLDVQQILKSRDKETALTDRIQNVVLRELREEFSECPGPGEAYDLQMALDRIYEKTGEGFIFVIDEWDCVFRSVAGNPELQREYLDFLCNLFKGSAFVDLVYMTGILPIKKYGEHSAINMFEEFSVVEPDEFNIYFGFTEEEVRKECRTYVADFDEMRQWYDGYLMDGIHIYNPNSVKKALLKKKTKSFWAGTETYEALKIYIELNYDGLKEAIVEMLGGGRCRIDTTSFQNDMTTFHSRDDVLTLLVHLGYLTYDKASESVCIPNLEVKQEFLRAIKNGTCWTGLIQAVDRGVYRRYSAGWH